MKKFIFSVFTITLGMVMVCASFALASEDVLPNGNYTPEGENVPTAILTPPVSISKTTTLTTPATTPEEWFTVTATAYCPCEKCCGKWAKNRPDGIVYTASGDVALEGVTIAADWSVYPPGMVLYIDGLGERIVQDRGGAIKGNAVDVYFEDHDEALVFGRQTVRLYIVEGGDGP